MTEQSRTPVSNQVYNLTSVLYHSLEGSQTYDKYIEDAGSNEELARFFREIKQQDDDRAQRALQFLDKFIQH